MKRESKIARGPVEWFRCDRCGLEVVGRERDGVVFATLDRDVPPSRPERMRAGRCPACCDGSEEARR